VTGRGLPAAARRHVWVAVRWTLITAAVMGVIAGLSTIASIEQRGAGMARARGTVVSVGDGTHLQVRYRHPVTHQVVTAGAHREAGSARPQPGDPIRFHVARDDPLVLSFRGPSGEGFGWGPLIWSIPLLPFIGLVVVRLVRMRQVMRLVGAPMAGFAMIGVVVPWGRRGRPLLHLFALDATPEASPVASVRLLSSDGAPLGIELPVEAKGSPRPLGMVVARAGERVLWPEGRATPWPKGSRRRPARHVPRTPYRGSRVAGWCAAVALATSLVIAVTVTVVTVIHAGPARRLEGHGLPVLAEVTKRNDYTVGVRYRLSGDERDRIGAAPADFPEDFRVGIRYPAHVDPDRVSRIRLDAAPFDTVEPLVWGWVWTVPPSIWLVMAWRHRRRVRAAARAGPWRTVDARVLVHHQKRWLLGLDGASTGAVTAAVWIERPPLRGRWPEPGPITVDVAGVVEPGRTMALRRNGTPLEVLGPASAG
jgi:hypothetical protein